MRILPLDWWEMEFAELKEGTHLPPSSQPDFSPTEIFHGYLDVSVHKDLVN